MLKFPKTKHVIPELVDLVLSLEVSDDALTAACEAVVDLMTSAVAAPRELKDDYLADAFGAGASSIWFTGEKASLSGAGFANALQSAALDLDDGHRKSRGHPGAAVIPAVFAKVDHLESKCVVCTDEQILRAIIVGYEIGIRIAAARGFYARTGFWAGFAAAAAAGFLSQLNAKELANAIAIAGETGPHMATTTSTPPWPQPFGSDVKEGIPWGVVTGLSAVHMAKAGMTGAVDLVDYEPFFDAKQILAGRQQHAICETYTKFYAACRHIHAPVDALISMMDEHNLKAGEITKIDVAAYSGALRISNRADPLNLIDAQYSIPYCLALVALRGQESLLPMTNASLNDQDVIDLARKVKIVPDFRCEQLFPENTAVFVTVHSNRGTFQSVLTTPKGESSNRPSWDERMNKFEVATRDSLSPEMQQSFFASFADVKNGDLGRLRQLIGQKL